MSSAASDLARGPMLQACCRSAIKLVLGHGATARQRAGRVRGADTPGRSCAAGCAAAPGNPAPVARRRAHVEVPVKRSCPAACGPSARGYYGAVRAFLGPRTHGFSIVPPWFKGGRSFCALAARPRAACAAAGTRQRKQGCRGRGRAPPHGRPECTALVSACRLGWSAPYRLSL